MKSGLVEWFGLGLVCAWVWVQTLLRAKLLFFLPNFLVHECGRVGNLAAKREAT